MINIYANRGDQIFVPNSLGFGWELLWFVLFIGAFSVAGWFLGIHLYDNPEDKEAFKALKNVISNNKRANKNKDPKHVDDDQPKNNMMSAINASLTSQVNERMLAGQPQRLSVKQQARVLKRMP